MLNDPETLGKNEGRKAKGVIHWYSQPKGFLAKCVFTIVYLLKPHLMQMMTSWQILIPNH